MGMVVRTNTMAMNANRQLSMNNSQVAKSLEKLSSGFRINRAADDASGLAISEKMKAQIKGLEQASANSQDGISLIQTAEGGLTEVHNMLNRMVELATKSANGTIRDDVDREAIQTEVDALNTEITRISKATNFNGINLLDGSLGGKADGSTATIADFTIDGLSNDIKSVEFVKGADKAAAEVGDITVDADGKMKITVHDVAASTGTISSAALENALKAKGYDVKVSGTGMDAAGDVKTVAAVNTAKIEKKSASLADATTQDGFSITFKPGKTGMTSVSVAAVAPAGNAVGATNTGGAILVNLDQTKDYTAADINKMLKDAGMEGMSVSFQGAKSGADVATGLGIDTAAKGAITEGTGNMASGLTLQIGDTNDEFNKVTVSVDDMSATGIGTAGLNVSNQDAAGDAIDTIKSAINKVSTNRANLGALQNRLEYTINNLDTTAENMNAANSRIRDTDMAKEMMNYTKMNILTQAAQAMLAQANQQPQAILQLLQ